MTNKPIAAAQLSPIDKIICGISGILGICMSALVLLGWLAHIDWLVAFPPGTTTMKANAAVGLLMSAISLWTARRASWASDYPGRIFSLIVGVIGLLTLWEYVSGSNLGIDQFLVADRLTSSNDIPGRMSAITAVNLACFAAARLLAGRKSRAAGAAFIIASGIGFFDAFLAAVGYAYNLPVLYHPLAATGTSVSLSTTICFLLLFSGLAATRPDLGLARLLHSRGAGGKFSRRLLPAILLAVPFVGWFLLRGELAGLYGSIGGITIFAVANVVFLTALLWRAAAQSEGLDNERQNYLKSLQGQKELLSIMVQHAPAAIAMFDRDMRYILASDRWRTDFNLGEVNLVGRSHYDIFPEIPDRWKDIHRRCLAGEAMRNEDDVLERADGTRNFLRWEVRPWGERAGQPEGILIFSEDTTARRQIEEKIREQRALVDKILATAPGAIRAFRLRPDGKASVFLRQSWVPQDVAGSPGPSR